MPLPPREFNNLEPELYAYGGDHLQTTTFESLKATAQDPLLRPTTLLETYGQEQRAQGNIVEGAIATGAASFARSVGNPIDLAHRFASWGYDQVIGGPKDEPAPEMLNPDQVKQEFGPLGVSFDHPVPRPVAEAVAERKREEAQRAYILENAPGGITGTVLRFGTGMGVSLTDPIAAAAAFIPGIGEAGEAALAARVGLPAARLVSGASAGIAGTAALQPVNLGLSRGLQLDYSMGDALYSVLIGGALGGAFHAGLGAARDLLRARVGRPELDDRVGVERLRPAPTLQASPEAIEGAARSAVAQMARGEPVEIAPIFEIDRAMAERRARAREARQAQPITAEEYERSGRVLYGGGTPDTSKANLDQALADTKAAADELLSTWRSLKERGRGRPSKEQTDANAPVEQYLANNGITPDMTENQARAAAEVAAQHQAARQVNRAPLPQEELDKIAQEHLPALQNLAAPRSDWEKLPPAAEAKPLEPSPELAEKQDEEAFAMIEQAVGDLNEALQPEAAVEAVLRPQREAAPAPIAAPIEPAPPPPVEEGMPPPAKQAPAEAPSGEAPRFNAEKVSAVPPREPGSGPVGVYIMDASKLKVDAKRFQFKQGNAEGLTGKLKNVKEFDQVKAGQGIAWLDNEGETYVVNGHQRTGLARAMKEANPKAKTDMAFAVFREADGYTAEDVMVIAAAANIAEGSGDVIDMAKIGRLYPDIFNEAMPLSEAKVSMAHDLTFLAPEAFGMVVNEVVPYQFAATVGRLIPDDPARQKAAMDLLAHADPASQAEADSLVRQVRNESLAVETQTGLFGEEQIASSLAIEKSKVEAAAERLIRQDKKIFSTLTKEAGRIEAAGNVLAQETNAARAQRAGELVERIQRSAYLAGPISDALTEAARAVKDGTPVRTAARRFIDTIAGEIAAPSRAGLRPGEGGRNANLGPDGEPIVGDTGEGVSAADLVASLKEGVELDALSEADFEEFVKALEKAQAAEQTYGLNAETLGWVEITFDHFDPAAREEIKKYLGSIKGKDWPGFTTIENALFSEHGFPKDWAAEAADKIAQIWTDPIYGLHINYAPKPEPTPFTGSTGPFIDKWSNKLELNVEKDKALGDLVENAVQSWTGKNVYDWREQVAKDTINAGLNLTGPEWVNFVHELEDLAEKGKKAAPAHPNGLELYNLFKVAKPVASSLDVAVNAFVDNIGKYNPGLLGKSDQASLKSALKSSFDAHTWPPTPQQIGMVLNNWLPAYVVNRLVAGIKTALEGGKVNIMGTPLDTSGPFGKPAAPGKFYNTPMHAATNILSPFNLPGSLYGKALPIVAAAVEKGSKAGVATKLIEEGIASDQAVSVADSLKALFEGTAPAPSANQKIVLGIKAQEIADTFGLGSEAVAEIQSVLEQEWGNPKPSAPGDIAGVLLTTGIDKAKLHGVTHAVASKIIQTIADLKTKAPAAPPPKTFNLGAKSADRIMAEQMNTTGGLELMKADRAAYARFAGEKFPTPEDEAARQKRRVEMGYTQIAFRAGHQFQKNRALGMAPREGQPGAVFFAEKPAIARDYGGIFYPVYLRTKGFLDVDWKARFGKRNYDRSNMNDLIKEARKDGYPGIIARNIFDLGGTQTQYIVLDNSAIRGWAARFDPEERFSGDYMAKLTGWDAVEGGLTRPDGTPFLSRPQAETVRLAVDIVRRLPEGVTFSPIKELTRAEAESGTMIEGAYDRAKKMLYLTARALDPVATLRHEEIHVLRDLGQFTDQEWELLKERAGKLSAAEEERYRRFLSHRFTGDRLEDALAEESVARMVEQYQSGARYGLKIDAILQKIVEFFDRLRNVARGLGFQTADDVIARIESGEVGRRPQAPGEELALAASLKVPTPEEQSLLELVQKGAKPSEIEKHPLIQSYLRQADTIPDRTKEPGYGTPEWKAKAEYMFNGERVVGWDNYVEKLTELAKSYANGPIRNERRAVILIGPPAAGKSTIAEEIAPEIGAAIPDPDDAKKGIPGFNDGIGSSSVHEESGHLWGYVAADLARDGSNMVIPKVGAHEDSIRRLTDRLHEAGYHVDIVLMKVDPEEAFRRSIARFINTRRLITPKYMVEDVDGRPEKVYDKLRNEAYAEGFGEIDNNGRPHGPLTGTALPDVPRLREGGNGRPTQGMGREGQGAGQEALPSELTPFGGIDFQSQLAATKTTTAPAARGPDGRGWRVKKEGDGYIVLRMGRGGLTGEPPHYFRPSKGQTWTLEQAVSEASRLAGGSEQTAAGTQFVLPGAEKISQGELFQRKAKEPKRSTAPQKGTEGLPLFEDYQYDLVEMARMKRADEIVDKAGTLEQAVKAAGTCLNIRG